MFDYAKKIAMFVAMKVVFFSVFAAIVLSACSSGTGVGVYGNGPISLEVSHGGEWSHEFPFMKYFHVENEPQIAVWTEDSCGNYLETIYVTRRSAKSDWRMADGARRPEALPVWSHKRGVRSADGTYMPEEDDASTDGFSGATPKSDFSVSFDHGGGKDIYVFMELNHSADYNEYFTEANSGMNGQPSVVYRARIDAGEGEMPLVYVGHGSVDGSDGSMVCRRDSLSTALDIIESARLRIK